MDATKGNGLTTPHSQPAKTLTKHTADSAIVDRHGKALADQIARLALVGHHVIKGDRGDFTVCKYGLTRYCADFSELQAFAQKLGVNQ